MIPDELIEKTKRAIHRATGQHLAPTWEETPQWYRVGVTEEARLALETVAADIWDEGYEAGLGEDDGGGRLHPNPYERNENA